MSSIPLSNTLLLAKRPVAPAVGWALAFIPAGSAARLAAAGKVLDRQHDARSVSTGQLPSARVLGVALGRVPCPVLGFVCRNYLARRVRCLGVEPESRRRVATLRSPSCHRDSLMPPTGGDT